MKGPLGWIPRPLEGRHVTLERPPAYARKNPRLSWDRGLMAREALHFSRRSDGRWTLCTGHAGIKINGQPVTALGSGFWLGLTFTATLEDGDEIDLGDLTLRFTV
jgi:hypothetical protein